jgi:26S proteasome regulatory subunit N6
MSGDAATVAAHAAPAEPRAVPLSPLEALLEEAERLLSTPERDRAVPLLQQVLNTKLEEDDAEGLRVKEQALQRLGEAYARQKQPQLVINTILAQRQLLGELPKAKAAKLLRRLFEQAAIAGADLDAQVAVCETMIEWASRDRMVFVRHRLELRLAQLQFEQQKPQNALNSLAKLLKEVRRLEDRSLLVEAHLLESRVQYSIKNFSKSRAALVAARTNANAIYVAPLQQAELDMQSGILHAEENDYKTAFSYLYEAFEGYHGLGDRCVESRVALIYMVLTKTLSDKEGDELRALLLSKNVQEYKGQDVDALRAIAEAYKLKDTHLFRAALEKYKPVLDDPIVTRHLGSMYDQLLEGHLLRLVKPYSRVQIDFLADSLKLPAQEVEERLSQMILDHKLSGIVDQQDHCVVLFEEKHPTELYKEVVLAIEGFDKLVDTLFEKLAGKYDNVQPPEDGKKDKDKEKAKAASK